MKKRILAAFAALLLLCCIVLPAAAETGNSSVIRLRVHSDVAGCTEADSDRLLEILSPQVKWYEGDNHPTSIQNAAGGGEYAHMDAGRKYVIQYTLTAADGYALPDELAEDDISIECGKGATVIYSRIADMYAGREPDGTHITHRVLRICAEVVVDGTPLQRIIGWFRDLFLRMRWWQLY